VISISSFRFFFQSNFSFFKSVFRIVKVEFSFLNHTTISSPNNKIQHKINSNSFSFQNFQTNLISQRSNTFTTFINSNNRVNFKLSIHHWPIFEFIDNLEYDVRREEEWRHCNDNINDLWMNDTLSKLTIALAKELDSIKIIIVNVIAWYNAVILHKNNTFCKLLTLPTEPHRSQGYVHFTRVDDITGSNFAYFSSCSRIGEKWMKNIHEIFQSRSKLISTNVEFTFNASVISLMPSSPISLPVSHETQVNQCIRDMYEPENPIGMHQTPLTVQINKSQCRVHFQHIGKMVHARITNWVGWLDTKGDVYKNQIHKNNASIHLPLSSSTVNVVFTFNASAICAAPSTPITFPVYFRKKREFSKKN